MQQISLTLSIFGAVVTVILLLSSIASDQKDRQEQYFTGMLVSLLVILVTDSFDWLMNGNVAMHIPLYISNTINYSAGYLIVVFFVRYLGEFVEKKGSFQKLIRVFDVMCMASVFMMFVNLFTGVYFSIDMSGEYVRGSLYWLSQLFPTIALIVLAGVTILWKGMSLKERLIFASYSLFQFVGIGIDFFTHGLSLTYTGAVVSALIIYIQIDLMRGKQLAQQEGELTESRIKIMLSQIQPHFLYNALSTIRELCRVNPAAAEQATIEFSDFLRGNMESLTAEIPVPFEQELEHTKNYLALEKLRFEKRLDVSYWIEATDFRLPPLTLQPLVENAVRYGVTKKEQGGIVTISSIEKKDCFEVTILDDGVGFDTYEPKTDGRTHIGIKNVQERLNLLGGELSIHSITGEGTVSVIRIWKDGGKQRSFWNGL